MNQCKKEIMKGHKNKGKKTKLERLPPSSLVLDCSFHNLNESKHKIYIVEKEIKVS
jgi:hypothetical protein